MRIIPGLVLAAGLAAAAFAARAQDQVTWYLSTWGAPRGMTAGMDRLVALVSEKTGGNFKILMQYGEAISPARENLDGLAVGVFEMAHFCPSYHPGKTPVMMALELPFLPIPDLQTARRLATAFYKHPGVIREMERFNAVVMMQTMAPRYELLGTGTPPLEPSDFDGKRVRAPGNIGAGLRALGARLTSMPAPEIYTALERGLIDAAALPFPSSFVSFRIHEVADWYTYNLTVANPNCAMAVNKDALAALPDSYRQALLDSVEPAYDEQMQVLMKEDEDAMAVFKELGLARVTYSAAQIAGLKDRYAGRIWDTWVQSANRRGLPGQEILDFILENAAPGGGEG